jgi:hypothetical protein
LRAVSPNMKMDVSNVLACTKCQFRWQVKRGVTGWAFPGTPGESRENPDWCLCESCREEEEQAKADSAAILNMVAGLSKSVAAIAVQLDNLSVTVTLLKKLTGLGGVHWPLEDENGDRGQDGDRTRAAKT